jgi:hypothetical protein
MVLKKDKVSKHDSQISIRIQEAKVDHYETSQDANGDTWRGQGISPCHVGPFGPLSLSRDVLSQSSLYNPSGPTI